MDDGWIALVAAGVGAIVGGAASAGGAYLLERHRRITETRIELYRVLLPELRPTLDKVVRVTRVNRHYGGRQTGDGNPLEAQLMPVIRAAQTGGSDDQRHAVRMAAAWAGMLAFHDDVAEPRMVRDDHGGIVYPKELADEFLPLVERLDKAVTTYESFLERTFE